MENKSGQKNSIPLGGQALNGQARPPVIAVMGHIDHGKSTLLDYIRKSNIVEKESGGITQHISAYEVSHKTSDGKEGRLTFLDTPGHEAFGALRARGARIADMAVLVISAEDGVKPQTLEALKVIKESGIPYIIAINKIDLPGANVEKTKTGLAENEIYIEGYGGSISAVEISAKTGQGVNDLLDMLVLLSDMEELKGDPHKNAKGFVLENNLDSQKGISATLIIKDGTLQSGMFVVAEKSYSPVRIMEDFSGSSIKKASFSSPIRIIGWNALPQVGTCFVSLNSKKEAEKYIEQNQTEILNQEQNEEDTRTIIPIIIEADTSGSLEAIAAKIALFSNDRARFKITQSGVGSISESDIKLTQNNKNTIVIGFNVKTDSLARNLAERSGVDIQIFTIIYELTDFLEKTLQEKTPKVESEEVIGKLKVLKIFSQEKNHQVIGGKVLEGSLKVGGEVKVVRRETFLGEGEIRQIQKLKNKVSEATEGEECGLLVESKTEIAIGDVLENFVLVEK
ncbi:MAG: translation initiation factor IF-2 [Candidatus Pacebacteria bacterium]|nr:translation initiation factor IF-2 [Candidatus Paceibacterota bacterium]